MKIADVLGLASSTAADAQPKTGDLAAACAAGSSRPSRGTI